MNLSREELADFLKRDREKVKKLPERLYKYRSPDGFGLSLISKNEIFFSSFQNLNDPMEGRMPILYEKGTLKQMIKLNMEMLDRMGGYTRKERKKKAEEIAKFVFKRREDEEKIKLLRETHFDNLNTQMGVFSLSAVYNNSLLWAHYADGHKGICVSFKTKELLKSLDELIFKGIYKIIRMEI